MKHGLHDNAFYASRVQQIKALRHYSPFDSVRYGLLRAAMKRFPDRRLFCPWPFKQMEILAGGRTNLCCWIRRSPGNLHQGHLMDVWNSPIAQDIRGSILDGTFRYCDLITCPYFGSGKLPLQKDIVGGPYEEIIHEGRTRMDTMKLWLSFDQRCNLRCISCRNSPVHPSEEEKTDIRGLMELVKRDLPSITALGTSGSGDPFVSPVFRDFLFQFDSSQHQNLKLFLLTNGQLLTRECWEKMEKAHSAVASVQVSMDAATKATYEGIRLGGSYDVLMENLRFLSELRNHQAIGELILSFVVNARNFREMKMFVELGIGLGCDQVVFSFMSNWGTFTNEEYRAMAVHRPEHREHHRLKEMLGDPLFNDPRVFMHNLSGLQGKSILNESLFV